MRFVRPEDVYRREQPPDFASSLGGSGVEDSANGLLEGGLETGLVEREHSTYLTAPIVLLSRPCWKEMGAGALLGETVVGLLILTKIELGADKEEEVLGQWCLISGCHLVFVLERSGRDDGEANEEDVDGLG